MKNIFVSSNYDGEATESHDVRVDIPQKRVADPENLTLGNLDGPETGIAFLRDGIA